MLGLRKKKLAGAKHFEAKGIPCERESECALDFVDARMLCCSKLPQIGRVNNTKAVRLDSSTRECGRKF